MLRERSDAVDDTDIRKCRSATGAMQLGVGVGLKDDDSPKLPIFLTAHCVCSASVEVEVDQRIGGQPFIPVISGKSGVGNHDRASVLGVGELHKITLIFE